MSASTLVQFAEKSEAARLPPHNDEAEQALLAAILVNNLVLDRVNDFLRPEHFGDALHGRIYAASVTLWERGQIADPVTLKNLFDRDEALKDIGGAQYLAALARAAVTIIDAEDYARAIYDLYLRRQLIDVGSDIVNRAFDFDPQESASEQIEQAEQRLFQLAEHGQVESGPQAFSRVIERALGQAEAAFKRDSHITGVTTGLRDIDRKLGGLQPSDLVILAGRPSMGKTALATNMGFNATQARRDDQDHYRVVFFSLEMSAEQLAMRIMAEKSGISSDRIRRGEVGTEDFQKIADAALAMAQAPFFIDDTPALTVPALRTRARRLKRQHGLDLIVVDYLQLMRAAQRGGQENRVQEISEITRGLKAVAKELNVPVLALSQLSRAVEQREDKRPQLADLRESGSIEQDADVVMFVYRDQYYHEREEPKPRNEESDEKFGERMRRWQDRGNRIHNKADVIIAKQRHGPIGTVELYFEGATTRFSDLAQDESLPERRG
ncbi:MAG TPA: replicative DNA helicase [Dongiaceae bacterium]|jgi:replicative DNA helicase|nr:replicative DNA helicase [Dongiaceae bacterium]